MKMQILFCIIVLVQTLFFGVGFFVLPTWQQQNRCSVTNPKKCYAITRQEERLRLFASTNYPGNHDEDKDTDSEVVGVTLKIALDATGGVAELDTEESERFTSPSSLDMVHRLRRDSDAILVGRGTVQSDNPSLLVRRGYEPENPCDQPLRVILDPKLVLAIEQFVSNDIDAKKYQIFDDCYPTVVYHAVRDVDPESLPLFDTVQLVQLPTVPRQHNERIYQQKCNSNQTETDTDIEDDNDEYNKDCRPDEEETQAAVGARGEKLLSVANIMSDLSQRFGVKHLMVEGGPTTALTFLRAGLVDRAILVKAPIRFRRPLPSGITAKLLQDAGLRLLGTYELEVDVIECWSRPHLPWPKTPHNIQGWP